jgi:hypothetical protein
MIDGEQLRRHDLDLAELHVRFAILSPIRHARLEPKMPTKRSTLTGALVLAAILGQTLQADDASEKPAKKLPVRRMRLDKTQPWLRADQFSVSTVNRAPRVKIRYYNDNAVRTAEGIKVLGSGTARDDFGREYKAFTLSMVDTLGPRASFKAEYSVLPKLPPTTKALLLLLSALEKRILYVQLRLNQDAWEIEEYGVWKDEKAYENQSEWVAERKKENPFNEAAAVVRKWRDESGEFSVRAAFVDFAVDKATGKTTVSLKRADNGKTIKVQHSRLSSSDRKYIRELKKKMNEKEEPWQLKQRNAIRERLRAQNNPG